MGEIAERRLSCAERASSGVGCSRNERVSAVARSRSSRAGGYAAVASPTASPAITGSMPDLNSATHSATPSTIETSRLQAGAKRRASSATASPTAAVSAGSETWLVYTVAITSSANMSSTTASVSRKTRSRVAAPGVSSASAPSANAVSVDIAAPHPCAPGPPALNAS